MKAMCKKRVFILVRILGGSRKVEVSILIVTAVSCLTLLECKVKRALSWCYIICLFRYFLHPETLLFSLHICRKEETVAVYPADVVLFEGILMFYSQEIRDLFQMKLFVDTDADTRLSRRGVCGFHQDQWISKNIHNVVVIGLCVSVQFDSRLSILALTSYSPPHIVLRDISERGRDLEQVLSQYITFVKPAFEEFCLPVSLHSLPCMLTYYLELVFMYVFLLFIN